MSDEKLQWYWKQSYDMGSSVHWALNDTDSDKGGRVSSAYMVLAANYPLCCDGLPLSEQPLPKRIIELLNRYGMADS